MGLLRTLLIILLVYYGVKILTRFLAPYFVGYMSKKMRERYGYDSNQQHNSKPHQPSQKVGETVIDKMPKNDGITNKEVGEYVDYEEIEE